MRLRREACAFVLALAPAIAFAQDAKGPCPGAVGPNSALDGDVSKPDRKPRRKEDGIVPIVQTGQFVMSTPMDEDRNVADGSIPRIVVLIAVVDTTGKIIPTSAEISESPSPGLSQGVCQASLQMQFVPALLHGQKVAAIYKERFAFHQAHMDINAPRGSRN